MTEIKSLQNQINETEQKLQAFSENVNELIKSCPEAVQSLIDIKSRQEIFDRIINSIPVMIIVYAPSMKSRGTNRVVTNVLGWTEEDAAEGDLIAKLYPDPRYRRTASYFIRSFQSKWQDFTATAKDGRCIETSWSSLQLSDKSIIAIGIDLREQKRHEQSVLEAKQIAERQTERLEENKEDLNRAQEVAKVGSWRLNVKEDVLTWSDETYTIFGIPKGTAMTYERFLAAVNPDDRDIVDRHWQAALHGEPYSIQHRILVNGHEKWIHERAELEFDEHGRLLGGFGTAQDITESKKKEEELRLSEERFSKTFSLSPFAVVITRLSDGTYIDVNDTFLKMFEYSRNEIIGRTSNDIKIFAESNGKAKYLDAFINGRASDLELDLRTKTGKPIKAVVFSEIINIKDQDLSIGTLVDITERKKAEAALHDSEERFRSLFEHMLDGYAYCQILFDKHGHPDDFVYLAVNDSFSKLTGLKDVVGKRVTEVIPRLKELNPELLVIYGRVATTGSPEKFEIDFRPLGLYLLISVYSPKKNYFVSVFDDITERKQAEEAIRKSEEQLRIAMQVAKVGFFEWDVKTGVNTWSPELEAMYGLSPGQFGRTQASWEQLVHPADRAEAIGFVNQAFSSGESVQGEWRAIWPDKTEHWISGRFQGFKDASGQRLRLIGVNIDITERKRSEETIRMSEERYRLLFENINESFFLGEIILDSEGKPSDYRFIELNPAYERNLGLNRSQLVGKTTWEAFHRVNPVPIKKFGEVVLHGKPARFEFRSVVVDKLFEIHAFPIGQKRFAALLLDITEQKKAEAELKKREFDLTRANKELESFSYSVSHDLRAPLRAIDGFSQALLEDYQECVDDRGKDYLNRVRDGAKKMDELIDAILRLSRQTRKELHCELVDFSEIVHNIVQKLREEEPERKVIVNIERCQAFCDRELCSTALENLLRNAWKFTKKKPEARIHVGCMKKDNEKVYFVKDNGSGFDMKYADKLFVAFQRLHDPRDYPGIGIGLSTVQQVIHKHGGRIWAEGEVGKGATFYFTLPNY